MREAPRSYQGAYDCRRALYYSGGRVFGCLRERTNDPD